MTWFKGNTRNNNDQNTLMQVQVTTHLQNIVTETTIFNTLLRRSLLMWELLQETRVERRAKVYTYSSISLCTNDSFTLSFSSQSSSDKIL